MAMSELWKAALMASDPLVLTMGALDLDLVHLHQLALGLGIEQ